MSSPQSLSQIVAAESAQVAQALLAEGSLPSDPAAFSRRLTDLMAGS